jgi:hypothetical protein
MAGAITVGEVITMHGVEAIIMDGAIIAIGETPLPSGNHAGRSRLSLATFSFEKLPWPQPHAKAAKVSLDGPCRCVLCGGALRRAVLERGASSWTHCLN